MKAFWKGGNSHTPQPKGQKKGFCEDLPCKENNLYHSIAMGIAILRLPCVYKPYVTGWSCPCRSH